MIKGGHHSELTKEKMSKFHLGKKRPLWVRELISKKMKGRKLSMETKNRIRVSILKAGNRPPIMFGIEHPRWKGGITPLNTKIRNSLEYRLWRKDILQRDNYKCQMCGDNQRLQADHKKLFSLIILENNICEIDEALKCEELWNLDNGRTLCSSCHYFITIGKEMTKDNIRWGRKSLRGVIN